MSGIGDQTLNIAKGLKATSSNVTIGTTASTLKSAFVKICKQKNTPDNKGISLRGNHIVRFGENRTSILTLREVRENSAFALHI